MKICPKCNTSHNKSGQHCSRSCANSRIFSDESKIKKSLSNKKYFSSLSDLEKKEVASLKRSKYNYDQQQRQAKETKIKKSWSRPYEEMGREALRRRLIFERNNRCEECGISQVWNNKPLTLEMDHIDGNNKNNDVKNLRILCPNCHSQTETFRARNIKKNKDIDIEALTEALKIHKFATPALKSLGYNNTSAKMKIANEILEKINSGRAS